MTIDFLPRTLMKTSANRSIDWNRLMLRNKVVVIMAVDTEIQNSPAYYEDYKEFMCFYTRSALFYSS